LRVLKVLMGYEYLWNQVRIQGGAYGCMCNFGLTGLSFFVSYRDPHLERTVQVFKEAASFIREYQADERTVTKFIIGALGDLDTPMTPAMKGAYGLSAYMSGMTYAWLQRERDELLGIDEGKLRALHHYIEAFIEDDCFCVVGSEEKLRENEGLFMSVKPLFS
jgi:Zn-dependent M16 (insulinase) family peptidase